MFHRVIEKITLAQFFETRCSTGICGLCCDSAGAWQFLVEVEQHEVGAVDSGSQELDMLLRYICIHLRHQL